MSRRTVNLSLARDVVDHLDLLATRLCVSRSVVIEALARSQMAGDISNFDAHVSSVHATLKAAEVERGRQVAALGRAAQRLSGRVRRGGGGRPVGSGGNYACSLCGEQGHSRRTCPKPQE